MVFSYFWAVAIADCYSNPSFVCFKQSGIWTKQKKDMKDHWDDQVGGGTTTTDNENAAVSMIDLAIFVISVLSAHFCSGVVYCLLTNFVHFFLAGLVNKYA